MSMVAQVSGPAPEHPEDRPARSPLSSMLAIGILASGVTAWGVGVTFDIPTAELITQPLFIAGWLLFITWIYRGIVTRAALGRPIEPASRSEWLGLIGLVALLVPILVVVETWIKWITNDVLYEPAFTLPAYGGLLRGVFEQIIPDGQVFPGYPGTDDLPRSQLSLLAHHLGFVEETHPYAMAAASPMTGDVIWAVLATAIGTGRLRYGAPLLARAFRIAGLMAATAPLFTMIYFLVFGGDGVAGWYSIYGCLFGMADDGTWFPMWIRVCGIVIFFLLPPVIAGWQLRSDLRTRGADPVGTSRPAPFPLRTHDPGTAAPVFWVLFNITLIVPLLAVWISNLALGRPYSWRVQTLWLVLWFSYLEWTYQAIWRLMPEGRAQQRPGATAPGTWVWPVWTVLTLLALTIANLVIQVGGQWMVAAASLGAGALDIEFFGWFLGQVKTSPSVALPPAAIGMPLVGNALWAGVLLWLGSARWQPPSSRMGRLLRLGSLQAATTPLMMAQYLTLSMLTKVERQRLPEHVPAVDLWGNWSYVIGHAIEGSSLQYQATLQWLVIGTLFTGFIALPFGFFALRLSRERNYREIRQPALATRGPIEGRS